MCVFSFIFISLEVLNFENLEQRKKFFADV